jgi:tRNA (guanine-N7-)-methyltransferase
MRQRKIKNIEEKLAAYGALLVDEPETCRGQWRRLFDVRGLTGTGGGGTAGTGIACPAGTPDLSPCPETVDLSPCPAALYAEIGCGKGRFITESALSDPGGDYLAFEGQESVLYRALQRACAGPLPSAREIYEAAQKAGPENAPKNLRFIRSYIEAVTDFFEDGELDGIYLNFSDPWPKARQEKRRLTSPHYLAGYRKVLVPEGFLRFKTDNEVLFRYSIDQIAAEPGLEITKQTDDLHNSKYAKGNIETEYERKFGNLRRPIHFVEAIKRPTAAESRTNVDIHKKDGILW